MKPSEINVFDSYQTYSDYRKLNDRLYHWRTDSEQLAEDIFSENGLHETFFDGWCEVCNENTKFRVGAEYPCIIDGVKTPNLREHCTCMKCGFNSRMRGVIKIVNKFYHENDNVYIMEQVTPLFKYFDRKINNLWGSEFLDQMVPLGETSKDGIRNEDVTNLSFDDEVFNLILFEHVFRYVDGFRECFRTLKSGGWLIFTAPFCNKENTVVRAIIDNGEVRHLLEPEYHGNPISSEGCLCFQHFGWSVLDDLKKVGFSRSYVLTLWSRDFGYMGLGEQYFIVAQK